MRNSMIRLEHQMHMGDQWERKWQRYLGEILEGFYARLRKVDLGFPGGAAVENLPANAGDTGSSPGLGRSHMPRSN